MNVWMAPASDPSAAKRMTNATDRPIPQYFWAPDSQSLLYVQDKAGDENYLLYQVDVASGAERVLTPFEKTRVQARRRLEHDQGQAPDRPQQPRPAVPRRAPARPQHRRDSRWCMQNDEGYAGFLADDSLTLRWAIAQNAAGGTDMFEISDGKVAETPRESTGLEDALTTSRRRLHHRRQDALLDRQPRAQHRRADRREHRDRREAGDRRERQGRHRRHDAPIPKTGEVEAYSVNYLRNEWTALDPRVKASLDWLDARLEGDFGVQSRTEDDSKWVVWNDPLTAPSKVYLYDRTAGTLTEFYTTRPELVGAPLQPMHPLEIPARDGLTLTSYLTLPPGSDPDGDGVPERGGADGAAGPRRPVGARRLRLQPRAPVARQPRLRGAQRQLPRLDRVRQGLRQRGQPRMGRQDARRPDRRGRVGGRPGHRPAQTRWRSWAAATAATPRSSG